MCRRRYQAASVSTCCSRLLREGLGKLAPTASRDGTSFGCQQRRVAWRHLEKLSRLTTIAYRTRFGNHLAVDEKPKQHAIFRHAHRARFHVFGPRAVDAMQSRND